MDSRKAGGETYMRELFEEYGKTVLATVSSALLIGISTAFITDGQIFDVIRTFSQNIC